MWKIVPRRGVLLWIGVSLINGTLLWHFHDRYWYPTDDGLYAHLAERILNGEVLNVDIQDIHPGYIHFIHAAAFRIFGLDMVSLRYPLMLAAFVQGWFAFALLHRRNALLAALGSIAITVLSVLQFYDPTPNWYCLSLCVILVCWLVWLPNVHPARLVGAGMLVGVLMLFRQLSGVWVMMAVLVLALLEHSTDGRGRSVLLSRALLATMLLALIGYLIVSPETEPGGVLLIAIWPIRDPGLDVREYQDTEFSSARKLVAQLALGTAIPALPLVLYHVLHGSLGGWMNDTVLAAFGETQMPFFGKGWYAVLPLAALYQVVSLSTASRYSTDLLGDPALAPALNGTLVIRKLTRGSITEELALPVLHDLLFARLSYLEGPPICITASVSACCPSSRKCIRRNTDESRLSTQDKCDRLNFRQRRSPTPETRKSAAP